jgi:proton-dependent oligopeptide transporter, POT family
MSAEAAALPPRAIADLDEKTFFGHPRALATLFLTEMWERFSYYGLRAILVLFLVAPASQGGLGLSVGEAAGIYALYSALVYMFALPGGWVGDRVLGQRTAVLVGGITIAAGHFTMLINDIAFIYLGLGVIVVGTGLLKPNMSTMVGGLYRADDPRRDAGFSIFYMGINLGAFLAPLIVGYLGQDVDWNLGFAAAGVGMLLGIGQYVFGWRYLGEIGHHASHPISHAERNPLLIRIVGGGGAVVALLAVLVVTVGFEAAEYAIDVLILALPIVYFARALASRDRSAVELSRVRALIVLFIASAVFWLVYDQAGSTLSVFAEDDTRDSLFGISFPASWFQSVNPVFILALAPVFAWLWVKLGDRQPPTPVKFSIGLLLVAVSMGVMVLAALAVDGGEVSPLWLVGVYFIQTCGELALSPVGLSASTKLAPQAAVGTTMGIWFLSTSVGDVFGGQVAKLYDAVSLPLYFGMLGVIVAVAGIAMVAVARPLLKLMAGVR